MKRLLLLLLFIGLVFLAARPVAAIGDYRTLLPLTTSNVPMNLYGWSYSWCNSMVVGYENPSVDGLGGDIEAYCSDPTGRALELVPAGNGATFTYPTNSHPKLASPPRSAGVATTLPRQSHALLPGTQQRHGVKPAIQPLAASSNLIPPNAWLGDVELTIQQSNEVAGVILSDDYHGNATVTYYILYDPDGEENISTIIPVSQPGTVIPNDLDALNVWEQHQEEAHGGATSYDTIVNDAPDWVQTPLPPRGIQPAWMVKPTCIAFGNWGQVWPGQAGGMKLAIYRNAINDNVVDIYEIDPNSGQKTGMVGEVETTYGGSTGIGATFVNVEPKYRHQNIATILLRIGRNVQGEAMGLRYKDFYVAINDINKYGRSAYTCSTKDAPYIDFVTDYYRVFLDTSFAEEWAGQYNGPQYYLNP